jgi:CelD/BcsL family acetyltransferase involved in cellulose biosynthesis
VLTRSAVIDPINDSRWLDLVLRASDATVFHHPEWLRLLRDQYRYPIWAVCVCQQGGLTAGVPIASIASRLTGRRLVSLPFSDVVRPVLGGSPPDVREQLLAAVETERGRLGIPLEIHADVPGLAGAVPGDRFLHQTMPIDGDPGAVLAAVHSDKRRQNRRAREKGVEVRRRVDRQAIDEFFGLHVRTRHKHGVPTQPKRFFRHLEPLFAEGLGFVLTAEHADRVVAASVYLQFKGVMTLKYNASDPERLELRANTLISMEALRLACEEGCHTFDFGRTELDNSGLREFKRHFGAGARELTYTRIPVGPERRRVRWVAGFQKAAIRRAPPVFGRLLGAALYRHFA